MEVGIYGNTESPPVPPRYIQAEEFGCAKRVVGVAIAAIAIGAAYYLTLCGMREGTCKFVPESEDAYSFLHDIMGLVS